MSYDPQQQDPQNWYQNPEPPPKSGCGFKILMGLLIGGGVLLLVCCIGGYIVYQQFANMVSADPTVVRTQTGEIIDAPPEGNFEPMFSMDMKVPFTDNRLMTMVVWRDGSEENPDGVFVLCEFNGAMFNENPEQMKQQMRDSLKQQGQNQEIQELSSKTVTYNVRGKPTEFQLVRGRNNNNGKEVWQVSGMIEGKRGPTMIMMILDGEKYSEEQVQQTVESIK